VLNKQSSDHYSSFAKPVVVPVKHAIGFDSPYIRRDRLKYMRQIHVQQAEEREMYMTFGE